MNRHWITAILLAFGLTLGDRAHGETIFSADFNNTKTAQVAGGSATPVVAGIAVLDDGGLDTSGVSSGNNGLKYDTAGNFNPTLGTLEMWFRVPIYNGSFRMDLFSIFAGGYTGDFGAYVDSSSGGQIRVYVDGNGVTQYFQDTFNDHNYYADGNWHHFAWEWDLTAGTSTLYLDGQVESTSPVFGTPAWPTGSVLGANMEFGSRQGGWDNWMGHIDDVRISDTNIYGGTAFTPPQRTIASLLLGDGNNDGVVDGLDIPIFLAQLNGSQTPTPAMDLNQDSVVDGLDIPPFLSALAGGTSAAVPEPASLALLGLGGLALLRRRAA